MEETLSQLLDVEQRIHHVYLCRSQLMFCKNSLLAAYWQNLIQQVNMGPSVLAAQKARKTLLMGTKKNLHITTSS